MVKNISNRSSSLYLFITTSILILTWFILKVNDYVRLIILFLYILTFIIYNEKRKKQYGSFEKFYYYLTSFTLIIFFSTFLFLIRKQVNLSVLILLFFFFFVATLAVILSIYILNKTHNPWVVLFFYLSLVSILIILFGILFSGMGMYSEENYIKDINGTKITTPWKAVYFSSVTFYTLGYGDITPVGKWASFLSQIEVMFGVILHVIILGNALYNIRKWRDIYG